MNGKKEVLDLLRAWIVSVLEQKENAAPEMLAALPELVKAYLDHGISR